MKKDASNLSSAVRKLSEPLLVGNVRLRNRVFLAPLSGITDLPFRERAFAHGAGMVVSEMVASGELAKGRDKSALRVGRPRIDFDVIDVDPECGWRLGRSLRRLADNRTAAEGEGNENDLKRA